MIEKRLQYGVLKGHVSGDSRPQAARNGDEVHFHIHAPIDTAGGGTWDTAINVGTDTNNDLLMYRIVDPYDHPMLQALTALPFGYKDLTAAGAAPALDFRRGDVIPGGGTATLVKNAVISGDDVKSSEPYASLDRLFSGASAASAPVYIFGHRYTTGRGVHDIHMNQGSTGPKYTGRLGSEHNDVWEDGAVLIQFADRWVAFFSAFSGQRVPTEDDTGNPKDGATALG